MSTLTLLISHKFYLIFSFPLCPQGTLLCLGQHTHTDVCTCPFLAAHPYYFLMTTTVARRRIFWSRTSSKPHSPHTADVTSRLSALVRQWRALTQSPRLARQDKRGGGQRQVIALSADVGMCQQAVGTIVVCSDFI